MPCHAIPCKATSARRQRRKKKNGQAWQAERSSHAIREAGGGAADHETAEGCLARREEEKESGESEESENVSSSHPNENEMRRENER